MTKLNDQTILITGASTGFGRALAIEYAHKGANIILLARRKTKLFSVSQEIKEAGGTAYVYPCDIRNQKQLTSIIKKIFQQVGVPDILINNAGIYIGGVELWELSINDWNSIIDTNLRAPFIFCNTIAKKMVKQGSGKIVNVLSATHDFGFNSIFRVSKVGVETLTIALSQELNGSGVAVMGYNPGWMKTESSSTGRNPKWAARVLTKIISRPNTSINGAIFDFVWRKSTPTYRRKLVN